MAPDPATDQILSGKLLRVYLLLICLACTLLALGWILGNCTRGFDFTDEGYYLVWMARPFRYDWSLSQFGFIYHPLYNLLGGNIGLLRQANVLIIFGLGWLLAHTFLRVELPSVYESRFQLAILSAAIAIVPLMQLKLWLPTPNYNSLCLQALLLTVTGALLAGPQRSRATDCGWILIAIGGWLALMAKPSTAAALAPMVAIYLGFARKMSVRGTALTAAFVTLLLIASAQTIDGSISGFVARFKTGADFSAQSGAGYTLGSAVRLDDFQFYPGDRRAFVAIVILTPLCAFLLNSNRAFFSWLAALLLALCVGIFDVVVLGFHLSILATHPFQALLMLFCPVAVIVFGLLTGKVAFVAKQSASHWALILLLLFLPYAYVFGSNSNYWETGSSAGVFWFLAGLALFAPILPTRKGWVVLVPFILVAQGIVATLVQSGIESPYRQPEPLRLNAYELDIGTQGSTLRISDRFGTYIERALADATRASFRPNDPMIDLSGRSPGLLYALRADSVGYPWIAGGYPGSQRVATLTLRRVSCSILAESWLLTESTRPDAIPLGVIASFGADASADYALAASLKTAEGEGAGGPGTRYDQQLLKPTRPKEVAIRSCEAARSGH
jgi:hypothetical protein